MDTLGLLLLAALAWSSPSARAEITSFRNAHPVAWMHQLPVGESPGWTGPGWFNLEAGQANVWNKFATFTNADRGAVLNYEADFEQSTVVADVGVALGARWSAAVEVPYANRNGGFMDAAIDQFHILIGADRFLRNRFGEFGNTFVVQEGGVDQMATTHAQGVGSLKAKLKYWWLKFESPTPGSCPCGVAFSAQAKVPVQRRELGLTSGHADFGALVHFGLPVGQSSGAWLTAAYTRLGRNDNLGAWPLIHDQRMFEVHADLSAWRGLGVIVTLRTESPLVDAKHLRFNALSVGSKSVVFERMTTAWNALTQWRGSEAVGLRWRWRAGHQFDFLITEDFGVGDRDGTGNAFYSNNAPDVAFISRLHLTL